MSTAWHCTAWMSPRWLHCDLRACRASQVTAAAGGPASASVTMSASFDGTDPVSPQRNALFSLPLVGHPRCKHAAFVDQGYPFTLAVSFTYTLTADGMEVAVRAPATVGSDSCWRPAPCWGECICVLLRINRAVIRSTRRTR